MVYLKGRWYCLSHLPAQSWMNSTILPLLGNGRIMYTTTIQSWRAVDSICPLNIYLLKFTYRTDVFKPVTSYSKSVFIFLSGLGAYALLKGLKSRRGRVIKVMGSTVESGTVRQRLLRGTATAPPRPTTAVTGDNGQPSSAAVDTPSDVVAAQQSNGTCDDTRVHKVTH